MLVNDAVRCSGCCLRSRRNVIGPSSQQWGRFHHLLNDIDEELYVRTNIERDRDGYAPRDELFTGFDFPAALSGTLLKDYRAGFPSACVLFPNATLTLSTLRASGRKLGLITDGSVRMQSAKIECLALAPMFLTRSSSPMPKASANQTVKSSSTHRNVSASLRRRRSSWATILMSM